MTKRAAIATKELLIDVKRRDKISVAALLSDIYPIQDVVPSAVRIADAIDTIICAINLIVSFFVIALCF
jgi:hypothetical protein